MLAAARRLALDVEALVLPVACLACQRPAASGRNDVLCDVCRHSMRPIAAPQCGRCGQTLDAWEQKDGAKDGAEGGRNRMAHERHPSVPSCSRHPPAPSCGFCRTWPSALAWAASAVWFDDVPRELAHGLKYSGWTVAAGPMAQVMARNLAGRLRGVDLLVPVPLGKRRLRERGYNQAAVLARALSEQTGIRLAEEALRRARDTKTQTALDPAARRANVAGAFMVGGGRGREARVAGKHVVLVDDVLTTGATLAAAAEALAAAGAGTVGAVTFARAAKPT